MSSVKSPASAGRSVQTRESGRKPNRLRGSRFVPCLEALEGRVLPSSFQGFGIPSPGGPNAVSADGSVIVGNRPGTDGISAFRWSATTGLEGLPTLFGGPFSSANGVSADGSVIVGEDDSSSGQEE